MSGEFCGIETLDDDDPPHPEDRITAAITKRMTLTLIRQVLYL